MLWDVRSFQTHKFSKDESIIFASAEAFQQVVVCMSILRYVIASNCKLNKTDIATEAEDFICDLMNVTLGYELVNLNRRQKNHPVIDLASDAFRISIQVTADSSRKKIKETITGFYAHEFHKKYDTLLILNLTQKKKYAKSFRKILREETRFDIWDIDDLIWNIERERVHYDASDVSKLIRDQLPGIVRAISPPDSLFSRLSSIEGIPPKDANDFVTFIGTEDLEEKRAVIKGVENLFAVLRDQTYPQMREFLAILLKHARQEHDFEYMSMYVKPRYVGDITYLNKPELKELSDDLVNAGLLVFSDDIYDDRAWLKFRAPQCDFDFLCAIRKFVNNDLSLLRAIVVSLDFSLLDRIPGRRNSEESY